MGYLQPVGSYAKIVTIAAALNLIVPKIFGGHEHVHSPPFLLVLSIRLPVSFGSCVVVHSRHCHSSYDNSLFYYYY
jgi:hypothetical protein